MESLLKELFGFLTNNSRPDVQFIALNQILDLTGTPEVENVLVGNSKLLMPLIVLLKCTNRQMSERAALTLINISAYKEGAKTLLSINDYVKDYDLHVADPVYTLLTEVTNCHSVISDSCSMILSNMTRSALNAETVLNLTRISNLELQDLIEVFTKVNYNKNNQMLHYLGPLFENLSQSAVFRNILLEKSKPNFQKLLPFTEFKESAVKRRGVVGTLRNCCFLTDYHNWLLNDVGILPHLLLPLAGNTEFDDEDNDKLPPELQYLPEDKVRDDNPEIRCLLLETLIQLCALRESREFMRNSSVYVVLSDLHKWETDKEALQACENLIEILIREESDIGYDNLKEVDVPDYIQDAENVEQT